MSNNGDENLTLPLIYDHTDPTKGNVIGFGNFHKTLPHNEFGEVSPAAYHAFVQTANDPSNDFESVPTGSSAGKTNDGFNNPQAGRSTDVLTGGAAMYEMGPAPSVLSRSTAAEFTELQWMALLRDVPLAGFATNAQVQQAVTEVRNEFVAALGSHGPHDQPGLRLDIDLPKGPNHALRIDANTLFRAGLPGEEIGPFISQFFLHDIDYGAQYISQKVQPYAKHDYLTAFPDWLAAQNTGKDGDNHGYGGDNDHFSHRATPASDYYERDAAGNFVAPRHIATMRDLCRFVNKDALHQAYFNAALLCLN